jgi:hypothetical protein
MSEKNNNSLTINLTREDSDETEKFSESIDDKKI